MQLRCSSGPSGRPYPTRPPSAIPCGERSLRENSAFFPFLCYIVLLLNVVHMLLLSHPLFILSIELSSRMQLQFILSSAITITCTYMIHDHMIITCPSGSYRGAESPSEWVLRPSHRPNQRRRRRKVRVLPSFLLVVLLISSFLFSLRDVSFLILIVLIVIVFPFPPLRPAPPAPLPAPSAVELPEGIEPLILWEPPPVRPRSTSLSLSLSFISAYMWHPNQSRNNSTFFSVSIELGQQI